MPPAIVAAVFPQAPAAAAGSPQHLPVEPHDRGPARQLAVAAAAAEPAAVPATAARRPADAGLPAARLARRPNLAGDRFIFLVDTSASMSGTDVAPTRLEAAKQQILGMIDQMRSTDVAMLISFSDIARVEQSFTNSRPLLRQKVNQIRPTNRTSDLREALRAAAGLANPGRTSEPGNVQDVQVADPRPATLYLYTDGGFAAVPEFSLGNLEPQVHADRHRQRRSNVAIAAFTAERNPEKPTQLQAFARLENTGGEAVTVEVSLYRDGKLLDAAQTTVPADGSAGVQFDLEDLESGTLQAAARTPGPPGPGQRRLHRDQPAAQCPRAAGDPRLGAAAIRPGDRGGPAAGRCRDRRAGEAGDERTAGTGRRRLLRPDHLRPLCAAEGPGGEHAVHRQSAALVRLVGGRERKCAARDRHRPRASADAVRRTGQRERHRGLSGDRPRRAARS